MKEYGFLIKCLETLDLSELALEPQITKDIWFESGSHFYSFTVEAIDLKRACIKAQETKVWIEGNTDSEWELDAEVACEGQFYDLLEE